jgi:magnesium transporter
VRERIRADHGIIRENGPAYLTYALIDASVDSYFPALERIGEHLESLEESIVGNATMDLMAEVRSVKRRLMTMRRHAWPQREMVSALMRAQEQWVSAETRTHLRDAADHAVQVLDLIENHRELASGLMDFHMSMVSHRMNEIMKVLTITATIFIPLSFVAGLYGMNFDPEVSAWNMPELGSRFGYPVALLVMAALAGGMLVYFKRRGWIGSGPKAPRGS